VNYTTLTILIVAALIQAPNSYKLKHSLVEYFCSTGLVNLMLYSMVNIFELYK
jgi:hypothetical protein